VCHLAQQWATPSGRDKDIITGRVLNYFLFGQHPRQMSVRLEVDPDAANAVIR